MGALWGGHIRGEKRFFGHGHAVVLTILARPNLYMMLIYDLGYHNAGFHNPEQAFFNRIP